MPRQFILEADLRAIRTDRACTEDQSLKDCIWWRLLSCDWMITIEGMSVANNTKVQKDLRFRVNTGDRSVWTSKKLKFKQPQVSKLHAI